MSWRARACAVAGAIVCAGIVGPGAASAADPVGIEGLTGQIEAAVFSELAAAVPQPAAASSTGGAEDTANIEQATAEGISAQAQALGPAAPATLATTSTASPSSEASPPALESELAQAGVTQAPPEAAWPGVVHTVPAWAGRPKGSSRSSSRMAVTRTRVALAVRATARSETSTSYGVAIVRQRVQAVSATSGRARSSGTGSRRSSVPSNRQPRPPAPGPERPDMSSPAQGGGQGLLLPLVIAALAALLAMLGFDLLPRVLPLPAFRKPRRIVLPPWHPG